jgi:hypothetical protein
MELSATIDKGDLELIRELYVFNGFSVAALAKKWEVTYKTMHNFISRNKIRTPAVEGFTTIKAGDMGVVPMDGAKYLMKKRNEQLYVSVPAQEFFEMQKQLQELKNSG